MCRVVLVQIASTDSQHYRDFKRHILEGFTVQSHGENVKKLREFVIRFDGMEVEPRNGPCYSHMGATICDTVLQAGLNYRTVVFPRIENLMQRWPGATSTSKFLTNIQRHSLEQAIRWKHPEKPQRIRSVTEYFSEKSLETEQDVADWLSDASNCEEFRCIKGIGPKTVDYLKSLVGIPAVAVDRHIRTFVSWAGVELNGYHEIQELVSEVADSLQVQRNALDHAIWRMVSNPSSATMQYRAA